MRTLVVTLAGKTVEIWRCPACEGHGVIHAKQAPKVQCGRCGGKGYFTWTRSRHVPSRARLHQEDEREAA
jgi:DnaJ-class molecular chaperone